MHLALPYIKVEGYFKRLSSRLSPDINSISALEKCKMQLNINTARYLIILVYFINILSKRPAFKVWRMVVSVSHANDDVT